MKARILLIALIVFGFSVKVISSDRKGYKPGYIITNQGDTVQGSIQIQSNISFSRQCPFLAAGSETPTVYKPGDIKAFRIEGSKYYVSTDLFVDKKREKLFLEYLVDGIVDLYYLKEPGRELYFIKKDTVFTPLTNSEKKMVVVSSNGFDEKEKTYSGNSNEYRRTLNYLFQESPDTRKKLESVNFQYKSLINITKDYHRNICTEYDCIDFTRQTKTPLFLELTGGMQYSVLTLSKSSDRLSDIQPSFGIKLRVRPFKGFSKYDLITGIVYNRNVFYGDMDNTLYNSYGWHRVYNIDLKYTALKVPVIVERSFGNSAVTPLLSFGMNSIFVIKSEHTVTRVDQVYVENSPFRNVWFGFTGGAGIKVNLNKNSYAFLRAEAEYRVPYANFNYVLDLTRVSSGIFTCGYAFTIN